MDKHPVDYVRIEIHAGGEMEVIELESRDFFKVRAGLETEPEPIRDLFVQPMHREVPGELNLRFEAYAPEARRTRKASDRAVGSGQAVL